MQLRNRFRHATLELDLEQLAEQVMEPVPLVAVVEGHQEQVRPGELAQISGRVGPSEDLVTRRSAELFQYR